MQNIERQQRHLQNIRIGKDFYETDFNPRMSQLEVENLSKHGIQLIDNIEDVIV